MQPRASPYAKSCRRAACQMPQPAWHLRTVWGLPRRHSSACCGMRLLWDDLPEEWRAPVPAEALADCASRKGVPSVFAVVCVELLDFPWAWHYERWARQPIREACRAGDPLPIVVVARADFRNPAEEAERRDLSARVLRSFFVEGRLLPLFSRAFIPSSESRGEVLRAP